MQVVITPQAGKRLIGKALARKLMAHAAWTAGRILVVAGTTNGYLAEELAIALGRPAFDRARFFRGVTTAPATRTNEMGRLADAAPFPGDLLIDRGTWVEGRTIFDALPELKAGDLIVKGANAIDLRARRGGVLIGHPEGGTIVAAITACIGRRVELLVASGTEKCVAEDMDAIARRLNAPGAKGYRFMPIPGPLYTELDAIRELTGADAFLVAAGGVAGAEGASWVHLEGSEAELRAARELCSAIGAEPAFAL